MISIKIDKNKSDVNNKAKAVERLKQISVKHEKILGTERIKKLKALFLLPN